MKRYLKKVGSVGILVLVASSSFKLSAIPVDESPSAQPVQIHCEISTRVVTGALVVGFNPLSGFLVYDLTKSHFFDPQQNFKVHGSNGKYFDKKLKIKSNDFYTSIHSISLYSSSRATEDKKDIFIKLKTGQLKGGDVTLESLNIDGVDHSFKNGAAYCDVSL